MKWFNIKEIIKEIKKIKWPTGKDLLKNSVQVLVFTGFFALFFFVCQYLVSAVLKLLGVL